MVKPSSETETTYASNLYYYKGAIHMGWFRILSLKNAGTGPNIWERYYGSTTAPIVLDDIYVTALPPQAETFFLTSLSDRMLVLNAWRLFPDAYFFPYSYTAGTRIWGPHDATRVAIAWAEQECMIEL